MQNALAPTVERTYIPLRTEGNSLFNALDILMEAKTLSDPALKALRYLEFIYAGELTASADALREALSAPLSPARQKIITKALASIKDYMGRFGSFPYPLNRELDEDRLVVEAIEVLQEALDYSLDRNMHTLKVREALRFLVWKDGNAWEYINFWNALTFKSGNGNWQNGDAALSNIRKVFNCYD